MLLQVELSVSQRILGTNLWQAHLKKILRLSDHSNKFVIKKSSELMSKKELMILSVRCSLVSQLTNLTMLQDKIFKKSTMLATHTCAIYMKCILMFVSTVNWSASAWNFYAILLPIQISQRSLLIVKKNSSRIMILNDSKASQIKNNIYSKTSRIAVLRLLLISTW